jgi:hypothetical protein
MNLNPVWAPVVSPEGAKTVMARHLRIGAAASDRRDRPPWSQVMPLCYSG